MVEIKEKFEEENSEEEVSKAKKENEKQAGGEMSGDTAEPVGEETADESEPEEALDEEERTEDGESEEDTGEKSEKAKGFFKKKKDKRDEQIEELTDRVKRQLAEFENFRNRSEKEKSQMYDMGARTMIEKMLPVVDNFERGLAAVPEEQREDAFVTGMDKIYKQLMTELEAVGVTPIEAVGQEFNPEYHNAVMQVESEEYDSGVVAQELQKGYMYKDTVVRHSMVAVVS